MKAKHQKRAKYVEIRERVKENIRNGTYAAGAKMPTDRQLADEHCVTAMTVRRAFSDLVDEGLVKRRIGDGTYVSEHSPARLKQTTINLVCSVYDNALTRDFFILGSQEASSRTWIPNILRINKIEEGSLLNAIANGYSIVMPADSRRDTPVHDAVQKARGRAVLFGQESLDRAIPSVNSDPVYAMQLAVNYLRAAGHQRIGLIMPHCEHPTDLLQEAAWRGCLLGWSAPGQLDQYLIRFQTPPFESPTKHAFAHGMAFLKAGGNLPTAFVCLNDEATIGFMAACRELGLQMGSDISLINYGDSPSLAFAHPAVTCLDPDIGAHMKAAFEILDSSIHQDGRNVPLQRRIPSRLVERASVRQQNKSE